MQHLVLHIDVCDRLVVREQIAQQSCVHCVDFIACNAKLGHAAIELESLCQCNSTLNTYAIVVQVERSYERIGFEKVCQRNSSFSSYLVTWQAERRYRVVSRECIG